ncbi:hypothetical protein M407DRAFT_22697 [Tulasnella calospora MUT 4182]|uniref:Uncharacterized protein n=1 Tax=Tulasnella calospora MUT 4182 TaxID=1051891 RepID=A0A0C3QKU2_9AGAM|nr:hypothetical protein M407DRAFT_22697 [Tulasnella calospora MUT 4182]
MRFLFTRNKLPLRKDCKPLAPHRCLSNDFLIKDTSKGLYVTDLTEKGGLDPFCAHKRTLTIDMEPDALALLGADEEDQEEPVFTKAYVLRVVISLFLLSVLLLAGSSAGYLPPKGSIAVDTRVKWSIRGVPKEMRESGLVPWWKVALVSVNVDVVAGKRKGGGVKDKVLGDAREWGLEGGEWEQGHLEGQNEDLAAVKDFARGQTALMNRHPRLHRML